VTPRSILPAWRVILRSRKSYYLFRSFTPLGIVIRGLEDALVFVHAFLRSYYAMQMGFFSGLAYLYLCLRF
jgi:hypothetical protein